MDLNQTNIFTEKQLCEFIFRNFGPGHYMVLAWKKRRRGFWIFWKGDIEHDGFIFEKKDNVDTDELRLLKEEYDEEKDPDYRAVLEEEIEREVNNNKKRKYGFTPYLKPSSKRGEFFHWEDE
jgi:hypothetical protein